MIIKSNNPVKLERMLHRKLEKKYKRIGRLEIFKCKQHDVFLEVIKGVLNKH